jgi:hypothetical protein
MNNIRPPETPAMKVADEEIVMSRHQAMNGGAAFNNNGKERVRMLLLFQYILFRGSLHKNDQEISMSSGFFFAAVDRIMMASVRPDNHTATSEISRQSS